MRTPDASNTACNVRATEAASSSRCARIDCRRSAQGRVDVGAAAQVDTPGVLGDDEQATVEVNDADHYVVEVAGLAADDVQHDQRLSSTECSGDRRIRRTRGLTMLISGCGGTLKLTAVPIPTCFNGGPSGRTLRLPERIG